MLSRYVHVPSLQCVKIACKFTERFLRNLSFCRGTFFLAAPCILWKLLVELLTCRIRPRFNAVQFVWCCSIKSNQNVNISRVIKHWQEASLVYCTYQTKRDNGKNYKKTLSSPESMKADQQMGQGLWWEELLEKVGLSLKTAWSCVDLH